MQMSRNLRSIVFTAQFEKLASTKHEFNWQRHFQMASYLSISMHWIIVYSKYFKKSLEIYDSLNCCVWIHHSSCTHIDHIAFFVCYSVASSLLYIYIYSNNGNAVSAVHRKYVQSPYRMVKRVRFFVIAKWFIVIAEKSHFHNVT